MRTTGSAPCIIIVATAAPAACCCLRLREVVVVQKFVGSSSTFGTLQDVILLFLVLLPGLRQLKQSLNFCTFSRRSFGFIDLNFLQLQMACCPSLNGHSEFFGFIESSALDAKVLVFGFSWL